MLFWRLSLCAEAFGKVYACAAHGLCRRYAGNFFVLDFFAPGASRGPTASSEAEFRMIQDLPVLENYDVLVSFDVLSQLPAQTGAGQHRIDRLRFEMKSIRQFACTLKC